MTVFEQLDRLTHRPEPFEFCTADLLWTDEHISRKMLEYHLDETVDLASRNHAFIKQSAAWIIDRFGIDHNRAVCDFGCGPGLYAMLFAEAGADVTGVDFSERSIRYARNTSAEAGLEIDYIAQNYLDFATDKKFDLITLIFCDFCALSPLQRQTLLSDFREFLRDDGAVLLDVVTVGHYETTEEYVTLETAPEGGFWSASPYYVLTRTFKYPAEKLILEKHCIVEKERTREIYNWLQCFDRASIEAEFREAGLKVTEFLGDVGGAPFDPDSAQMAVVARRP
jgi:SAM-dependent methyltransferase